MAIQQLTTGPYVAVAEVAERLGVSIPTVYDRLRAGAIPCQRVGARYLIHRAQFEQWFEDGTPPVAAPPEHPPIDLADLLALLSDGEIELAVTIRVNRVK